MSSYDVVVVGGGPGGYVSAIRAAQLGLKTAIVERAQLGGVCLNWGCIPTKALLRSAELLSTFERATEFGLTVERVGFDLGRMVERSRAAARRLSGGIRQLMKKHSIEVFEGEASLLGTAVVGLAGESGQEHELRARHIILATGGRSRDLPGVAADGERIWNARHAMTPSSVPKSLVIVGSGPIGIEFASFYCDIGTKVTVVEMLDRILPSEDDDVSAFAQDSLRRRGIEFLTQAVLTGVETCGAEALAAITVRGEQRTVIAERILLATGIVGNTEIKGLAGLGVKVDKGHLVTDPWGHTGVGSLWAIGDLTGPPWLAHKASHEGAIVAEKIASGLHVEAIDKGNIPACVYGRPQIASVGLTERAARAQGHSVKVGRFPATANGKAIAMGEPEGFVKTVFDAASGELLGAHMIGAEVTELIQGFVIARALEATEAELAHMVFPHPTLSEMMHESTLAAWGGAVHF